MAPDSPIIRTESRRAHPTLAYRLTRRDRSATHALRRIAGAQLDAAVDALDTAGDGRGAAVHAVRKRCKKVRGLLRLVAPVWDDADAASDALRDAARLIGPLRDAAVRVATYDALVTHYGAQLDRRALASVRRRFTRRRQDVDADDAEARLRECRERLASVRDAVDDWTLDADDFDAYADGLRRTWRKARKAMAGAATSHAAEDLHTWRKRCKDHGYHAHLLRSIWPGPMDAHITAASALADCLGEHHDLAVFVAAIDAAPERFGDRAAVDVMRGLVHARQRALLEDALSQGRRLFADKPAALTRAWRVRYRVWCEG